MSTANSQKTSGLSPYIVTGVIFVLIVSVTFYLAMPGPDRNALAPGHQAVIAGEHGSYLEPLDLDLEPGVRVTVGNDQGGEDAYRKVKVTVESGRYQGRSGEVKRSDLRPIP